MISYARNDYAWKMCVVNLKSNPLSLPWAVPHRSIIPPEFPTLPRAAWARWFRDRQFGGRRGFRSIWIGFWIEKNPSLLRDYLSYLEVSWLFALFFFVLLVLSCLHFQYKSSRKCTILRKSDDNRLRSSRDSWKYSSTPTNSLGLQTALSITEFRHRPTFPTWFVPSSGLWPLSFTFSRLWPRLSIPGAGHVISGSACFCFHSRLYWSR